MLHATFLLHIYGSKKPPFNRFTIRITLHLTNCLYTHKQIQPAARTHMAQFMLLNIANTLTRSPFILDFIIK